MYKVTWCAREKHCKYDQLVCVEIYHITDTYFMLLSHLHFTCAQCFYTGSVLLLLCTLPLIHLMISFFLVDRFDKEQEFTSLQLSVVQSRSLVESLQEFVRWRHARGTTVIPVFHTVWSDLQCFWREYHITLYKCFYGKSVQQVMSWVLHWRVFTEVAHDLIQESCRQFLLEALDWPFLIACCIETEAKM